METMSAEMIELKAKLIEIEAAVVNGVITMQPCNQVHEWTPLSENSSRAQGS